MQIQIPHFFRSIILYQEIKNEKKRHLHCRL
nr:MAG TPA: hypothetical protein [Caudoviricetes sp.]